MKGALFLLEVEIDSVFTVLAAMRTTTMTVNNGVFSGMNYDEVNDILYCFSGSNVKQLQGTSYADLGDQLMPDSVMAVSVLYSK